MPGYRQSHALYVLREIKWIVCQCIVFMEKCISVPHDRTTVYRQCLFLQQFSTNCCKNSHESYSYNKWYYGNHSMKKQKMFI
jgi:hypothetical protein